MADAPDSRVHDWATDYDIFDPDYVRDPAPVWDDLRNRCPITRTQRWGGSWMPTRYEDLQKLAKMVPALSSRSPVVVPPSPELREVLVAEAKMYGSEIPPITSDPPEHKPYRRLILPFFSPHAVAERIPYTRERAPRSSPKSLPSSTGQSPPSSPVAPDCAWAPVPAPEPSPSSNASVRR